MDHCYNSIMKNLASKSVLSKEDENKLINILDTECTTSFLSKAIFNRSQKTSLIHRAVSKECLSLLIFICKAILPLSMTFDSNNDIGLHPINYVDEAGNTPLMLAVNIPNLEIAKLLVKQNGCLFLANNFNSCPLSRAIESLNYDMVEMMVKEASIEPWLNKSDMKAVELLVDSVQQCLSEQLREEIWDIQRKNRSNKDAINSIAQEALPSIEKDCLKPAEQLLRLFINSKHCELDLDMLLFVFAERAMSKGASVDLLRWTSKIHDEFHPDPAAGVSRKRRRHE